MDVYWWLSALTEYVYCPACWIILPHPWGKLIKTHLFGKQHFKGFCENFQFLIWPRICSQKIKDSQSRLKNSSIFMVSPPRSQEKGWLTLPHIPLPNGRYFKNTFGYVDMRMSWGNGYTNDGCHLSAACVSGSGNRCNRCNHCNIKVTLTSPPSSGLSRLTTDGATTASDRWWRWQDGYTATRPSPDTAGTDDSPLLTAPSRWHSSSSSGSGGSSMDDVSV